MNTYKMHKANGISIAEQIYNEASENAKYMDSMLWDEVQIHVTGEHAKEIRDLVAQTISWFFRDNSYIVWSMQGVHAYSNNLALVANA
jgi:hypothetical protein